MSLELLPTELLLRIFSFLPVPDLLVISLVNKRWLDCTAIVLTGKAVVLVSGDPNDVRETFSNPVRKYNNWIFQSIELRKSLLSSFWPDCAAFVKSLSLADVHLAERDLFHLLLCCSELEVLSLSCFSYLWMTGSFTDNLVDDEQMKLSLKNVKEFLLTDSRYVSDSIFSKWMSMLGNLESLSLDGCQISYQSSIRNRFYPAYKENSSSELVFTFKCIYDAIISRVSSLKHLSLARTRIDNSSLEALSRIPNLKLNSICLSTCDQFTKDGMQILTQNQNTIMELDISHCNRITDYGIMAIVENLPHIKSLNLCRCLSVSEVGIEHLAKLKKLEKLDISQLDITKGDSIHKLLGEEERMDLVYLNVASLPIQEETLSALGTKASNLRFLDISMCTQGVNDRSIQNICKKLLKLRTLHLNGCVALSDAGLSGFQNQNSSGTPTEVNGLELSIFNRGVDRHRVPLGSMAEQKIRKGAEVKKFFDRNSDQVKCSAKYGISLLKGLTELNLCGCLKISDTTLKYAMNFLELRYLNLSYCQQITEDGLICAVGNCPGLEVLLLAHCSNVTDRVVLVVVHRLKRIKSLDFQYCYRLGNDALDSLSSCRQLKSLNVSGCSKMSLEEVESLSVKFPRLHIDHRGIKSASNEAGIEDMDFSAIPSPPPLLSKLKKKLCLRN